ncbi:glycoside hydrolase family 88 protein [Kineococcus sp. SYSU DK005]|uniref:glycoside hydrolase family 88 protein n=1 Tax=Kineococcus sp. SYSU DK005 TaxID=3383126 RepID=UPI003D7C69B5
MDGTTRRALGALLALQRQSWEQGVTGHALLDLGEDAAARVVARGAVLLQEPDGRLASLHDEGLVNGAAATEVVDRVARATGDPALAAARDRQVRWLLQGCPRADDGTLFHLAGSRQVWADSVYMVVPALAATGHAERAAAQLEGHRRRLFDERTGLYAARWDEDAGELCDARAWGTGNGWVVAAIARTLHLLGGGAGDLRAPLAAHAREVLQACLRHRREDGAFGDVVDDPASFGEANLAQMLAYAVLTGVADGWLDPGLAGTGRDLLAAGRARVDADGLVTGVCGAPRFDRQGVSAEAQAFLLLATAAERRLSPPGEPPPAG